MFGAGGVGGYFGARLASAGHEVTFIARGAHLQALRTTGLRVSSIRGDLHMERVRATDDPTEAGPVDALFVAVKTWQLADAIPGIAELVVPETVVVPLLNGVEAAEELEAALGPGPVRKGLCKILSFLEAPGQVRHIGAEPYIALGEMEGPPRPRTLQVLDALVDAGIRAEVPEDIDVALWEKFVFVVSIGGVGAVTRAPVGPVRDAGPTRGLLRAAMEEIAAVGRGRGVALPDDVVDRSMRFVDGLPAAGSASLQRDLAAGRPSELEAWNGAVVRLGARVGVPTPIHGVIYASLLPSERRARREIEYGSPGEGTDPFRSRFLSCVTERFAWTRDVADRALAQMDDDAYFARLDASGNSAAVLVKHLAGNHRSRWTDFLTSDGEKADRDRDREFEVAEDSREELTRRWEEGWTTLFAAIRQLRPDDLDRTVTIRGEPHSVERALLRSLAHAAYHAGQIVLLAKHFTGPEWQTLSIPRGESEAWNRDMRARFD